MSTAGYKLTAQAAEQERRWATAPTLPAPRAAAAASAPTNVMDKAFADDAFWAAIGAGSTRAERAEEAAKASAVFFCCSIIAVVIGSLPREFRGADGEPDYSMPLAAMIDEAPNMLQTGDEFWSSLAYRAALAGAAYAEPVVRGLNAEIWPLDPLRTSVDWEDRKFTVTYLPEHGPQKVFRPIDLFWIAGLADAASRPLTPWRMAKGSIDFALAMEKQGRDFFSNGNRMGGFLSTEFELTDESIARIRQGVAKWKNGGIAILEQGLGFKESSSNNADAQMAELIKQRTLEMARYWHIPKSMIGEDAGAKANHEQEALDFVKYCIRPWARRIEQAVRQRLMTPDQRTRWTFKLNLDGLLRGDSATQFRNAVLARTAGSHSVNDIRAWFGLRKINEDWANDPRAPLNSNRAADSASGGQTAPQDSAGNNNAVRGRLAEAGVAQELIDDLFPMEGNLEHA